MTVLRYTLLILISFVLLSCEPEKKGEDETKEKKPIAVEYITSSEENVKRSVKGSGLTLPFRKTTVLVKSAGDVVSFNLKTGQKVKKGGSVIKILSRRQKAQLDYSKVQLDEAQLAYDATSKLYDKGSVSKAEFLNAKSTHSAAMGQLMANRIAYNDCFVKFPFGGIVNWYDEAIHRGSIVQPGTPICEIIDLSQIKVKLFFSEESVVHMSVGDSALVTIPVLDRQIPGTITTISPAASERTGAFAIEVTFTNSEDLVKAGMRAEVKVFTGESDLGYEVPKRFIREYRGEKGVYLAVNSPEDSEKKIAIFEPLTFYSRGSDKVFVTEGLSSEDFIITSGFSRLKDKSPVKISKAESGE